MHVDFPRERQPNVLNWTRGVCGLWRERFNYVVFNDTMIIITTININKQIITETDAPQPIHACKQHRAPNNQQTAVTVFHR